MKPRFQFHRTTERYSPSRTCPMSEQPGRPSVEELTARYAPLRLFGHCRSGWGTHKTPLTPQEVETINRLRATHTLLELGQMFGRHPSNIASVCRVKTDLRTTRSGYWRCRRGVA